MSGKCNKVMLFLLVSVTAGVSLLQAGSLEPPGPPAPTMVSLDAIPSSWHQNLSILRFEVVMNNEAVLDHETGLVWERNVPGTQLAWFVMVANCRAKVIGNRHGWRLPSVEELSSLIDPTQSDPALPPLHPFIAGGGAGASFGTYWTSTSHTSFPAEIWTVSFAGNGSLQSNGERTPALVNPEEHGAWCVRGSVGLDTGRP